MHLKRLEISGFKSFAKQTVLEFPARVVAIVGPNGSGKSNIAEALRWVLGEQSMKHLRGKRGEDLIFNGTSHSHRSQKACVMLSFHNNAGRFPLPYDEVNIGRCVWRDGLNVYTVNESATRLKDIMELLASIGLGASQHHIIGQGETDRVLHVSAKERQRMVEEALGLRVFQLKRLDAERKLAQTERNRKETEGLQREIRPHLKFLKRQAERYERIGEARTELAERYGVYLSWLAATIAAEHAAIAARRKTPQERLHALRKEMAETRAALQKAEQHRHSAAPSDAAARLAAIQEERMALARERGRAEGLAQAQANAKATALYVTTQEVREFVAAVEEHVSEAQKRSALEGVGQVLQSLSALVRRFASTLRTPEADTRSGTHRVVEKLTEKLTLLLKEEQKLRASQEAELSVREEALRELRRLEQSLHKHELEERALLEQLHEADIAALRLRSREEEYDRERQEAQRFVTVSDAQNDVALDEAEAGRLRREIERLKVKIEEAGGVDPAVAKEYEHLRERDEFFTAQLADLAAATSSLKDVTKELDRELDRRFKEGLSGINKTFSVFFRDMFSGGSAALRLITPPSKPKRIDEEDEDALKTEEEPQEEGIAIDVSVPRKRIRSLASLSGGERALTSVALLFAMASVHPPPFLVLDETDAALDEANSRRYAMMLKDLSAKTQVIVITHNRETMRHAQVLYGVTMGRDASSTLLSVKFEEAAAMAGSA